VAWLTPVSLRTIVGQTGTMTNDSEVREWWFSAGLRTVCLIEDEGASVLMDTVRILRASGWDEALRRAVDLGRADEKEYLNGDNHRVRWRLDRILTLDQLRVEDLDGAEVYSEFREPTEPLAFDTQFDPERSEPTHTGV
jgi:hypothetical protein